MLYVIYGKDFKKSRANLKRLTDALLKRRPDSNLFRMDEENFSKEDLEGFIGGQGLFEQKYIVILDKCLEKKENNQVILDHLKEIGESDNVFICIEENVDAKTLKKLEKKSAKIHQYDLKAPISKPNFKLFALTDALGSRNQKKAWLEYQKAIMHGISAEEIHSMLLWQTRSMKLTISSDSASDSGLKPFVFNKSRSFAKNYSKEEIGDLYEKLVDSYHCARRGEDELAVATEKMLLKI